jgi:hypothetical protein
MAKHVSLHTCLYLDWNLSSILSNTSRDKVRPVVLFQLGTEQLKRGKDAPALQYAEFEPIYEVIGWIYPFPSVLYQGMKLTYMLILLLDINHNI